jgi:hypothetical protein
MITAERLREVFRYYPETGRWEWLVNIGTRARKGNEPGWIDDGRRRIRVDGHSYLSSRLAVLWMTGMWPVNEIDHEDTNKLNDRWMNLREATRLQNAKNYRKPANNTSGLKGASWVTRDKKWRSQISVDGKKIHLGDFDCPAAAHLAYALASAKLHGEFGRVE